MSLCSISLQTTFLQVKCGWPWHLPSSGSRAEHVSFLRSLPCIINNQFITVVFSCFLTVSFHHALHSSHYILYSSQTNATITTVSDILSNKNKMQWSLPSSASYQASTMVNNDYKWLLWGKVWLTNEAEVPFTTKCVREKSNHLVQCYATINNNWRLRGRRHTPVHLFIHQPECYRFVADKCLVMALTVRNVLLTMTSICQSMHNIADVPFIIRLVFQKLQQRNVRSVMQRASYNS